MLLPVFLSPSLKFLLVSLIRVGLLAVLIAAIAALIGGAAVGIGAGALVVVVAFGYYAWKLAQLSEWLKNPTAATLPDARLLVLPDIGHTAQLEDPTTTARAILALTTRANDGN